MNIKQLIGRTVTINHPGWNRDGVVGVVVEVRRRNLVIEIGGNPIDRVIVNVDRYSLS